MPTRAEFAEAARQFELAAEACATSPSYVVRRWHLAPSTVGGPLTASIDDFVARLDFDSAALAAHLERCAGACHSRAAQIDIAISEWRLYNQAYDAYEAEWNAWADGGRIATPPQPPTRPSSPAWADLSTENLGAP